MLYKLFRCLVVALAFIGLLALILPGVVQSKEPQHETVLGTAWTLNENGYIVTAYHVVNKHNTFKAIIHGKVFDAELIASDPIHDLAILHIDRNQTDYLTLELKYSDGEKANMFGFPLPDKYGNSLKLSHGILKHQIVSSYFRITQTAVCPGNSGGPVVGTNGVMGVLTESVWPFVGEEHCSTIAQGPTAKDVANLATKNGILYHSYPKDTSLTISDNNVFEIYAWR